MKVFNFGLIFFLILIFSVRAQTVDFRAVVPLMGVNKSVNKPPKKDKKITDDFRVTCKDRYGAIYKKGHPDFNDCINNSGRFSGPRNKVDKSLDFMIKIEFN